MKKFVGLFLATTMAVSGAVASFAGENAINFKGTIAEADLTIKCDLPASGTLTIKPYSGEQIASASGLKIKNGETAATSAGETQVNYEVALVGYTSTATSADADNLITYKAAATASDAYTGVKKEVYMAVQLATTADGTVATGDDFKAHFAEAAKENIKINEIIAKKSEAEYTKAGDTYTKIATPQKILVEAEKEVAFRITGTMNPNAGWEKGDTLSVTPIFTIVPKVATKE